MKGNCSGRRSQRSTPANRPGPAESDAADCSNSRGIGSAMTTSIARGSRRSAPLLAAAIISAYVLLTPAANAQTGCHTYVGNIGGAPAQACIAVEGDKVSGSYFYFR